MEMTTAELHDHIDLHDKWLKGYNDGVRLNLRGADLRGADMLGADLRRADLSGANLSGANLSGTDLIGANLRGADLRGADLHYVSLCGTDLSEVNLSGTDLIEVSLVKTNLRGVNLHGSDLTCAALVGADLRGADLSGANLRGADLQGAYLHGADLRDADLNDAGLSGVDLTGADLGGLLIPVVPNIDAAILKAIGSDPSRLRMDKWHTCQTTHCRAGWAITLAGAAGQSLERELGSETAGALIYAASRPGRAVPDLYASNYASNAAALADIRFDAACAESDGHAHIHGTATGQEHDA